MNLSINIYIVFTFYFDPEVFYSIRIVNRTTGRSADKHPTCQYPTPQRQGESESAGDRRIDTRTRELGVQGTCGEYQCKRSAASERVWIGVDETPRDDERWREFRWRGTTARIPRRRGFAGHPCQVAAKTTRVLRLDGEFQTARVGSSRSLPRSASRWTLFYDAKKS